MFLICRRIFIWLLAVFKNLPKLVRSFLKQPRRSVHQSVLESLRQSVCQFVCQSAYIFTLCLYDSQLCLHCNVFMLSQSPLPATTSRSLQWSSSHYNKLATSPQMSPSLTFPEPSSSPVIIIVVIIIIHRIHHHHYRHHHRHRHCHCHRRHRTRKDVWSVSRFLWKTSGAVNFALCSAFRKVRGQISWYCFGPQP